MTTNSYLDMLEKKHRAYFNVSKNYKIGNMDFDLYAEFHMKSQRYFFITALDAYEVHEYRFIKVFKDLDIEKIQDYVSWLQSEIKVLAKPDEQHMSTNITGVAVVETGISDEVARFIKKYKYTKFFTLGLKGWCDIRLLGVDMASYRVVANNKGKEVVKDFEFLPTSCR